jgi:hypothetical protein
MQEMFKKKSFQHICSVLCYTSEYADMVNPRRGCIGQWFGKGYDHRLLGEYETAEIPLQDALQVIYAANKKVLVLKESVNVPNIVSTSGPISHKIGKRRMENSHWL